MQYCSIFRQYYYDRQFRCSKANAGGTIGGAVGGAIVVIIIIIIIVVIWKKKQAEKAQMQQVQGSTT